MRTRFLNTDYFTLQFSPNETLSFLNLPIPKLPPLHHPNLEQHHHHLFSSHPCLNLSLDINRLPIDTALSNFISQVTPQKIDLDYPYFEDPNEIRYSEKDDETSGDNTHTHDGYEFLQFEEPELDVFLENVSLPEEHMQILSEVPEIGIDPDFLNPEIKTQSSEKIQVSVYSVEDVTVDYDLDKKACVLEDDDFGQEQMKLYHMSFPFLEVDDMTLRNLADLSMDDELLSFPENIKSLWTQKDNLLSDGMELSALMQYNVLEFLSNHCIPELHLESELASVDIVLGMDITSVVDLDESIYCYQSMIPLVFQEYEFLEVDSTQIFEVFFEMQKANEPETCDWMFREDKNFKNFNELIVSSELALVDEIFKTMPTPIFSDDDKVKPLHAFIEKILDEIKPRTLSAFDEIYLDWHLLEEDKCNNNIFSCFQNALELDLHSIDFDWESFDEGKRVIDFVLSDYGLHGPKVEENEESLDMFYEGTSCVQLLGAASSKLLVDKSSKSGNRDHVSKENAEKVTSLFKSMSQFNDLDFFLNPGKFADEGKAPGTNATFPKEGESHPILTGDKNVDNQKMEEVFNFLPTEDDHNVRTSEADDKVESRYMPNIVPIVPYTMKSQQTQGHPMSSPEIVIVVNTQDFDKEMIVSRRSTYQKVLAMEKEGLQVVERDLELPVDIIIASAICLVWYDCRNIRQKATAADEASSCLPLCIENIATNVLTLLSYTFNCCILVFEGDISFLCTVMESSDGLYAAAASLGIDLQLFCTHSSGVTDEIILSNISYATKLYNGVCPKIPESETLAESFLTKFPSINPLTAHAILSSADMLIEFLEWSNERRILAVQQYHVPEESIDLLGALCSYGERESSKSTMTDCSSSVSSGPDSNKDNFNVASETRPITCIRSPQKVDIHVNDIWQTEPLNRFLDDVRGPAASERDNCWISRDTEILDELQLPELSFNDSFGQKQGSDIVQMEDPYPVSKRFNRQNSKGHLILDEIKMPRFYMKDNLDQNGKSEMIIKKSDWNNPSRSDNVQEHNLGEVIDLTDSFSKGIPSITNSIDFSTWMPETEGDNTRKSKVARRLSFDRNSHHPFPITATINSRSEFCSSLNYHRDSVPPNNNYPDTDMPFKRPKKLLQDVLAQGSMNDAKASPFTEEISHFGGTPLSKAINSANPQPGSPWTIEFLSRIREKSRLRQQSLPCDIAPHFDYSGSTPKVVKRRSPSVIEFFKYKGGSNPAQRHEQKKPKQSKHFSSSSKTEQNPASLPRTWTPVDKRSRQTLSFAMNGSGNQTRLVWTDGSAHRLNKRFRNQ